MSQDNTGDNKNISPFFDKYATTVFPKGKSMSETAREMKPFAWRCYYTEREDLGNLWSNEDYERLSPRIKSLTFEPLYTKEQLLAYGRQVREECAKVADDCVINGPSVIAKEIRTIEVK